MTEGHDWGKSSLHDTQKTANSSKSQVQFTPIGIHSESLESTINKLCNYNTSKAAKAKIVKKKPQVTMHFDNEILCTATNSVKSAENIM